MKKTNSGPVKNVTTSGKSASQESKMARQNNAVVPQDTADSAYEERAEGGPAADHKHIHRMHMAVARHGKR